MTRGLVVALYKEDISWLERVPLDIKVYIYDKSDGSVPNVGRDPHTFMWHIVEHYDELDDYTCFAQGHPFDHCPKELFFEKVINSKLDYDELGTVVFNAVGNGESGNMPLTKLYKELMGREQFSFEFCWGMQIILSKRLIQRRPKEFYMKIRDMAEELYKDPFMMPALERIWRTIWTDLRLELP